MPLNFHSLRPYAKIATVNTLKIPATDLSKFRRRMLSWFAKRKRDLPWRRSKDSYRIWLSEIMLQQTRVAAVEGRYLEFLKIFPTIGSLAAARTNDVLAAWSGLGYYRRARSAHKTAKLLVAEHAGRFPRDRERLKELPGIGEYTSAAIASIAFALPHAVVDGNVRRVLDRISGERLRPKVHAARAQDLLAAGRPGDFNQAMMELGATVCTPEPKCEGCPVFRDCAARGSLQPSKLKPPATKRTVHLGLVVRRGRVFLLRRPNSSSLMPGMWELPEDVQPTGTTPITLRHSITNTNYLVYVRRRTVPPTVAKGKWVRVKALHTLPLTGLARKILRHVGLL
jgi:A/G-specific adenine glycosylase